MKTLITIGLFLICTVCHSQEKKDSKIIVAVSDTGIFNKVVLKLYEEGYTLETKDPSLGFIATNEKATPNSGIASIKVHILVKDSSLTFSGLFAPNLEQKFMGMKVQRTFNPITFVGEKGGMPKMCWRVMEALAKQFGSRISYGK